MEKLKFLVVEDDLFYQTYVNDLLAETGVDIINVSDGEAGLAAAVEEKPDLIITDIEIPKTQGFVLFKKLRERAETRDIPVIMMSGKVEKGLLDRHSRLSVHADGYLTKPFSGQVLIDMIREVIGEEFGFSEVLIPQEGEQTTDNTEIHEGDSIPGLSEFPPGDPGTFVEKREITVLVVDDSRYICDITTEFLEELGVRVETASDGESGYSMASELLPALVLLDVQIPDMNGFVVCEMLRRQEKTKDIPIVLMSAVVDEESFQRHSRLKYHADAYLQKPFMKSELHDLVSRFISAGEDVSENVESKTGYFFPTEDAAGGFGTDASESLTVDPALTEELNRTRADLEEKVYQGSILKADLESVKRERDQLEGELFELRKSVEVKNGGLQDKLTLATQRFEEARTRSEELSEMNRSLKEEIENLKERGISEDHGKDDVEDRQELLKEIQGLKRDLGAANAAKKEIEDQAQYLLEKRKQAGDHVTQGDESPKRNRMDQDVDPLMVQAQANSEVIGDLRKQLELSGTQVHELSDQLSDTTHKLSTALKELEELRSRHADLEKKSDDWRKEAEEKAGIETDLKDARRQLGRIFQTSEEVAELKARLDTEKELRALAEKEIRTLKDQIEESASQSEETRKVLEDNRKLTEELRQARQRSEELEKKFGQSTPEPMDQILHTEKNISQLETRLDQLEAVLSNTVQEAQNVLKEQQDRESTLEQSVESLMRSLDEERSAYRRDREDWSTREGELKEAFEDAIKESRRAASEGAARFYPMRIAGRTRTLEVVSRKNRYGIAAAAAIAAVILFAGGYYANKRSRPTLGTAVVTIQNEKSADNLQVEKVKPPETWIESPGPQKSYEELWRQNTVQSMSADMQIQATLHTREELVAAIEYTADREGWTRERTEKAMVDLDRTYNLSRSYYITVYSKNLKGGYPGYADNFEKHLALRDQNGREVRAQLPEELEGSKFITSRISAAGKEMNPDFLYEVGLTVAFPREELTRHPEGLQLLLYDIGAVPMRVLTWDMSELGSFSYNKPDAGEIEKAERKIA